MTLIRCTCFLSKSRSAAGGDSRRHFMLSALALPPTMQGIYLS